MGANYEFNPAGRSYDTKKIAVIGLAVLVLFVLYAVGSIVTGYSIYSSDLEKRLNHTSEELRIISAAREECGAELDKKSSLYQECSNTLENTAANLQQCETVLNETKSCDDVRSDYSSLQDAYNNLVRNSVKALCCSFSDVEGGVVKNWHTENNKILCDGNFTVNCATGEINTSA